MVNKNQFFLIIGILLNFNIQLLRAANTYSDGSITVTWSNNNQDSTDFTMSSSLTAGNYFAFGLSNDQKMGDDNVAICQVASGDIITLKHYYNTGYSSSLLLSTNSSVGFSNIVTTYSNGIATCSFTRAKTLANVVNYFNLNNQYYILTAIGPFTGTSISRHSSRTYSSKMYNFTLSDISPTSTAKTLSPASLSTTSLVITTTQNSNNNNYKGGNIFVSWVDFNDSTNFTMNSTLAAGNYFAFGLSKDDEMGDDDVAVCFCYPNGTLKLLHNYNPGDSSQLLLVSNPTIGFSNIVLTYSNGIATCSFTRAKTLANVTNYFNLTNKYYLLTATGPVSGDTIGYHSSKQPSPSLIDFQINQISPVTNPTTISTPASNQVAGIKISWINLADATKFELSFPSSSSRKKRQTISNIYISFGLSNDKKMGDDEVMVCKVNPNGSVSLLHYFNNGKSPSLLSSSNPTIGFSDIKTSVVNGYPSCSFTRAKSVSGVSNYFDINNKYYLLTASGPVSSSGNINKHTNKASSSNQFNLLIDGSYTAGLETESLAKVKAHGCLMVFAWLFCASTGILFARYYKYIFPKVKLMKVQFWFFVHRPLMISVPIVSIIAFLVILSQLEWEWVDNSVQPNYAHSIIGIITIAFSVVQVFLAFFRCDKDHPKRFIFNHFHRTFGITTFILAIVTIFLGVCIEEMNLGSSGWGIMIGWTIWILILPLLLEIFEIVFTNKKKESYKIQDKVNGQNKPEEKIGTNDNDDIEKANYQSLEKIKSTLFLIHLVIATAFTLALIIVIGSTNSSS